MLDIPHVKRPKYLPRPFASDERERLTALELPPAERLLRGLLYYTGPAGHADLRDPPPRHHDRPGAARYGR
jgi:hypothetical protein